jgi:hypothetical protein
MKGPGRGGVRAELTMLHGVGAPRALWAETPVNRHDLKAHAAIENVPLPTVCIQSYFAIEAGLRSSQDLVGGGKRREGGGLCHNLAKTPHPVRRPRKWPFKQRRAIIPATSHDRRIDEQKAFSPAARPDRPMPTSRGRSPAVWFRLGARNQA